LKVLKFYGFKAVALHVSALKEFHLQVVFVLDDLEKLNNDFAPSLSLNILVVLWWSMRFDSNRDISSDNHL